MCHIKYDLYTVDRIEGNFAVCENRNTKKFINIPLSELPKDIRNGDILKFENGIYTVDTNFTSTVKNTILDRFNRLKK